MMESSSEVENISKFQGGSRPNRSSADQLFLLRACIDHAIYLNISTFLSLYDFKQCFDSMWLQDSTISLRNIGIESEKIALIKKLNENSKIVVKTPVGNTEEFVVKNIVKQGTVLGPLLCSASTAECCEEHTTGGVRIGSTSIKSLAYVDDIVDLSEDATEATEAHNTVLEFTSKKRLELSWKKCCVIPVNARKNTKIPCLPIENKPMKTESSAKYLGDIINSKGSHSDMIEDRVKKGDACATNIFSIVQVVNFGCHSMETTLLLYRSLFIATVLCNSQSWSALKKAELNKLKVCQMRILKRILNAPKSSPNAIVLGELGVLPIEYEIYSRKLMFLHHIVTLENDDPVKMVYHEQLKYDAESNWANEIHRIRREINLEEDDQFISDISKYEWKTKVHKAIKEAAVIKLNAECMRLKRTKRQYIDLKMREYLLKLPAEDAKVAFGYRSGTLDIKCHKSYMYDDTACRACKQPQEDTEHIVNKCPAIHRNNDTPVDIDSDDLNTISEIVYMVKKFQKEYQ